MPSTRYGDYEYTGSGTNSQGNQWDSRDYGPEAANDNSYHYSNQDGSYYYNNPDGSKYYDDGQGNSRYEAPQTTETSGENGGGRASDLESAPESCTTDDLSSGITDSSSEAYGDSDTAGGAVSETDTGSYSEFYEDTASAEEVYDAVDDDDVGDATDDDDDDY